MLLVSSSSIRVPADRTRSEDWPVPGTKADAGDGSDGDPAEEIKPKTTDSNHDKLISPNLLRSAPLPLAPGEQVVGDITYLPLIGGGFVYLATFQDRLTKHLVGWSVADSLEAEIVVKALQKALRCGLIKRGCIVHTDRGSQYVSKDYRGLLKRCRLKQSMSGKGNCYDNAQAESFFSRFKTELVDRETLEPIRSFRDLAHARQEVFSYIDGYYNRIRLHSSIDYMSPMQFEEELRTKNQRRSTCQSLVSVFS